MELAVWEWCAIGKLAGLRERERELAANAPAGAFIVLQQKGAHQSSGISSRLISRGLSLSLSRWRGRSRETSPPPLYTSFRLLLLLLLLKTIALSSSSYCSQ